MSDDAELEPREAAAFLTSVCNDPTSVATLAKWRVVGGGPVFFKRGRRIRYQVRRLREHSEARRSQELRSTSEPAKAA
jgi:hypothetical protein